MTTILDFASSAYSLQNDGWLITIGTVSLTAMLELVSLKHVKSICESESGRKLYLQGVLMNFLNNIVLGPLAYQLVNEFFMAKECPSAFSQCVMVLGILFGQALGYYLAHRWMHTPAMYWTHSFHHKFNKYVVPVTANAVSIYEYAIAYMLPFIAGSAVLGPDRGSMAISVCIISLNNLLIHTPALADLSAELVPWFFVSTADHIEHHRRLTTNYAAPTISIDRLLAAVSETKATLFYSQAVESEETAADKGVKKKQATTKLGG